MRVVFATQLTRGPVLQALQTFNDIDLVDCADLAEVASHVRDADALVISDPRGETGRQIAEALRTPGCKVRWIQFLSAGADGLLAHGVPDGVLLTNQGGAVAPAVAEHGMAMILTLARRLDAICGRSASHSWDKAFTPPLVSLEGKSLAIVGYGNIGRQLARRAAGFDMRILGVSRSLDSDPLVAQMYAMTDLDQALGAADVVALCVASLASTRHLMNERRFSAMKAGAMFINVSRGETVDQQALAHALSSGHLRGAFLDVTTPEPLPPDDPLWQAPNLIISPHTAGAGSTHTGGRIAKVVAENLRRFIVGEPLQHTLKV